MKWQKSKKTIKEQAPVFLFLTALTVLAVTLVSAKYTRETRNENTAVAKEFYFTSDLLDGGTHEIIAGQNGTADMTFRLMNHEDDLRYSETDITYQVTFTDSTAGKTGDDTDTDSTVFSSETASISVNSESNNSENVNDSSGISGEITSGENHDVDISLKNLKAGETYTVTAKAVAPYTKTLTGTIKVNGGDSALHATVSDKSAYIGVTVWTADMAKNVSITYCSGLIPDNTDPLMRDAKSAGTQAESSLENTSARGIVSGVSMAENISHVFRFFKSDTSKSYQTIVNQDSVNIQEVAVNAGE